MRRLPCAVLLAAALAPGCGDDGASTPDDAAVVDAAVGDGPTDGGTDGPAIDAAQATCTPRPGTTVMLAPFVGGLADAVAITSPPGDGRQFVVRQNGVVRVVVNGTLAATPFLDLSGANGPVLSGGVPGKTKGKPD